MMKQIKSLVLLLPIALMIFLSGCGGGGGGDDTPDERHVVSLQVSGADHVAAGFSTQLQVLAIFSDKTSEDVTYSAAWGGSDDKGIIRVRASGIVEGIKPGAGTVTVSYEDQKSVTRSTFDITVSDATVTELFVSPVNSRLGRTYDIPNGQSLSLIALANFNDGSQLVDVTRDVDWTLDQDGIVEIDEQFSIKNIHALNVGSVNLTVDVTSNNPSGLAIQKTITVTNAVLTKLIINPGLSTLPKGIDEQFRVYGEYSDNSVFSDIQGVTWSVENPQNAQITQDGLLTTLAEGETNILVELGVVQGQAKLVVNDAVADDIVISPAEQSIVEGSVFPYSAMVHFSDGTKADLSEKVDWQSSAPQVAEVVNGFYVKGIQAGNAEISASLTIVRPDEDDDVLVSANPGLLEVFEARVSSMTVETAEGNPALPMIVSKSETLLPLNQLTFTDAAAAFKADAVFENGETQDITQGEKTQWDIIDDQGYTDSSIALVSHGRVISLDSGKGAVRAERDGVSASADIVTTNCPTLKIPNPRANASGFLSFSCPLRTSEADDAGIVYTDVSTGDGIVGPVFDFVAHASFSEANEYCEKLNLDGHDDWQLAQRGDLLWLFYRYDGNDDANFTLFTDHNWPVQADFRIGSTDEGMSLATGQTNPLNGAALTTCVRAHAQ